MNNTPENKLCIQTCFEINLGGDEFMATVTYNDLIDEVEVTRVLFNVLDNFWAVLEPEHHGLIELQLTDHLTEEREQAKVDRQIERVESNQQVPYFLKPQAD